MQFNYRVHKHINYTRLQKATQIKRKENPTHEHNMLLTSFKEGKRQMYVRVHVQGTQKVAFMLMIIKR